MSTSGSRAASTSASEDREFLAEVFNLFNHQIVTNRNNSYYSVYNSTLVRSQPLSAVPTRDEPISSRGRRCTGGPIIGRHKSPTATPQKEL
jgi:hypothetical protein